MEKETKVVNQNHINDIVKSIVSNVQSTETILLASVKAITTIANKQKDIDVNLKKFRKLSLYITEYNTMVKDIIETFCTDIKQGKDLNSLLGRIDDIETKDGKKVKVTKFTVVDAAMQISNIIDSVFKAIEKAASFEMGFAAFARLQKNTFVLKKYIAGALKDLVSVFSDLATDAHMNDILKNLVKKPDVITELVENNIKTSDNNTTHDLTKIMKETKQGELGLLDVFEKTFSIVGLMANLKVPNLLQLKFQMFKLKRALKVVFNDLVEFAEKSADKKALHHIRNLGAIIIGDKNDNAKAGLFKMVQHLSMFLDKLKELKFSIRARKRINNVFNNLKIAIKSFWEILDSPEMENLTTGNFTAKLTKLNTTVNALSGIIILLKEMSFAAILFNMFKGGIFSSIEHLGTLIDTINKTFEGKSLKDVTVVNELSNLIDDIYNIQKKLSLGVLLFIPAMIGILACRVFIWALRWLITGINKISEAINKTATDAIKNFKAIPKLIGTIMLTAASLLLLAITAPVIVYAITTNILPLLGVLLIFVVTAALLGFICSKFIKFARRYFLQVGLNLVVMMGALVVSAVAILITALVAKQLEDINAVGRTLLLLLSVIAITAVMMLLGIALAAISPYVGVTIFGFAQIAIILGLMLGVTLMIAGLAKLDMAIIDQGKENAKHIVSVAREIIGALAGDFGGLFNKNRRAARQSKRTLKQTDKCVREIVDIAERLNFLQTIKIDETKITENVTGILSFTHKLEIMLSRLNAREKIADKDGNMVLTQKDWDGSAARQMKRHFRRNKKVLSKVDKVIGKLASIAEQLTSIAKFELGDTVKGKIETNLSKLFIYINSLDAKLANFNGAVTNDSVNIQNELREARRNKRKYRNNAKTISKSEKILVSLGSITDALNSIAEIKFNESDIDSKLGIILNSVSTVGSKIESVNITVPKDQSIIEENANIVLAFINSIAGSLKKISEIEIKSTDIDKNVTAISTTLNSLSTKLDAISVAVPKNKDEIIKDIESILVSLTTIETSLNSIAGFKFDLVGAVDSNFNGMLMSIKNVGVRIQTTLKSLPTSELIEKKIKGMLDAVKNSFETLNQIATLSIDDKVISVAESFKTTITDINTKLKHAALDLPNHKNVKQLNAIISYVNRLNNGFNGIADTDTESVEKNINNYIKFIDKVNTVEVKKLETSAQMFKQMASFSNSIKGNFEKLAETLAEDLMPILEELKTIMGQVPEKLDTGFQNTSASIAATTAAPTRANITAQVGRENPNLTREQIEKVVDTRLNEKANSEASSPLAKLDEIINLLKGTTGNAIVQIKS